MAQPKFKVDDIVSDCDFDGEFIIKEIGITDGFFYDYWVESLDSDNGVQRMTCYEDELTLIRKGE